MKRQVIFNRNKFVLGPSGSGKSFFTNHMVRQYYEQGAHVLLVDTGNSYKGLCELGGVYFTYEEDAPIAFNPFLISGKLDVEKKESIKTLLQALWKKDDEAVSQSEYVSLSTAVSLYYVMLEANPAIQPSFNTFYEFVKGTYRRVLEEEKVREKDFDIDNFLYVLGPYYRGGEYDYLLNSDKELDLVQAPFIVFELDNIKDHPILFPVVTLIIMETFISKMRKLKGVRKMILIEEAWKALTTPGMAAYIKYLFKTVRKFFGEAIVVTQEIDDIIGNEIVKDAIINNSDCKILLDQRKFINRFEEIQAALAHAQGKRPGAEHQPRQPARARPLHRGVHLAGRGRVEGVRHRGVEGRIRDLHHRGNRESAAVREAAPDRRHAHGHQALRGRAARRVGGFTINKREKTMKAKVTILGLAILSFGATKASAQLVVTAPVLEVQSGVQTGLQNTMKGLSKAANVLVKAGVKEQELTKVFSEKTCSWPRPGTTACSRSARLCARIGACSPCLRSRAKSSRPMLRPLKPCGSHPLCSRSSFPL